MRQRHLLHLTTLIGLLLTYPAIAEQLGTTPPALETGMVNPGHEEKPAWFKESFLDLREDIAEAKAANKRVILYFYQDGCPYCAKLLKDNFADALLAAQTQQQFEVIAINLWGDRTVTDLHGAETTEKRFATDLKVQYTPTLLFLTETGEVTLRVNGYYAPPKFKAALDYVAGKHETTGTFREFYAQRSLATPSTAITPLAGSLPRPLRLADASKTSGRHLLVLFEQGDCAPCQVLHKAIFSRPAIGYALSNMDVAQVDLHDTTTLQTPTGQELPIAEWIKALDIKHQPSLVFFAPDGKEVFRTEADLKTFHIHGAIDYVVSGAYQQQPSFQRFLQHRTDVLRARGFTVDLME